MKGFASDNYAGLIPEAVAAIAEANREHAVAYGADEWTARARDAVRAALGAPQAEVFLVFNGTAANVLCAEALCLPWEGVITTRMSHMNTDEGGAPEAAGIKLLTADSEDGKLTPERAAALVRAVGDEHAVQARVLSVAQSTELGTVYSLDELRALAAVARSHDLYLHVDGARIFNAAASLGAGLDELVATGIDALSLGGTKLGLLGVEAVVLLRPEAADGFLWRRKRRAQLASKMRFAAAQLAAVLEGESWRRHAAHANAMASRLRDAVADLPGVTVTQSVDANAIFAILDPRATASLQERFRFYTWDEASGGVRWMCSWDTTAEEVDEFAAAIAAAVSG